MDINVVIIKVGRNIAFLYYDLHHYCLQISPSLLTDIPRIEPTPICPTYWYLMWCSTGTNHPKGIFYIMLRSEYCSKGIAVYGASMLTVSLKYTI